VVKKKKKFKKKRKIRKKIRKKSEPRRRKKSKKTSSEGKKDLIIKSTRAWQKKAYVDRRMYEKKYDLSIKENEEFWRKEGKRIS